jgi:predicted Zn finger-like uncharacterized protein
MIVQCPNCQSKSRVDDAGAARGARVRCATCSHVFLPNTAVVQPTRAAATATTSSGFGADDTGGKTSLFTGVVSKAAIGLPEAAQPPAAAAGGDFGGNKTQAIDVSQLAAFSAKAPAAAPTAGLGPAKAAVPATQPVPAAADDGFTANKTQAIDVSQLAAFVTKDAAPPAAGLTPHPRPAPAPAPAAPRADVGTAVKTALEAAHPPHQEALGVTDVIGSARGDNGPMSLSSRLVLGLSVLLLLGGLIFFAAGRAVYAAAGMLGGQNIAINVAQNDPVRVERVTSMLYTLGNGHEALVVMGSVSNPGAQSAPRVELAFTLYDKKGTAKVQARAPLGAVLSTEELALLADNDSVEAELRRRVQSAPLLPAQAKGQKFMAVIKDPPRPLRAYRQALGVVPALPAEPRPISPSGAPSTADEAAPPQPALIPTTEVDSDMPAIVSPQAPPRRDETQPAVVPVGRGTRSAHPANARRRH